MRIIDPPAVGGWTIVILGGVALVIDTLTALLTYSMQKGSVNIRALFLHNLSDALASVAVVAGGTLILLYDWRLVDPLVTIGIAVYILYLSFREIGGPIHMLMLGSPPEIDNAAVVEAMRSVDGVADVHHVHLWQMQEHETALDCHVVVSEQNWSSIEIIKAAIKERLNQRFGIGHSSLEFEHEDHVHRNADVYGHSNSQRKA